MKTKLALVAMLAVGSVAPAAYPCGAPFGTGINVDPKQDIIVVHKNDVETYVFQPRFCGTASEFGLILPVPAQLSAAPVLSQASAFARLIAISQPQVVYTTVCRGMRGTGVAGGGANGSADAGATVISSGTVGFMDYAQLKADSVASFTDWLTANKYPYDDLATSAFSYYVSKGWYFVAFKISQGSIDAATTCKDLGPVKLSFPTTVPVVPTRMATARGQDTTGAIPSSSGFSWRIFGITAGNEEIGWNTVSNYQRVRNYSGLLVDADISYLDGLAQAGDRANKLTISFNYGSTDPDFAFSKGAASDYRETTYSAVYINCDASDDSNLTDTIVPPLGTGGTVGNGGAVGTGGMGATGGSGGSTGLGGATTTTIVGGNTGGAGGIRTTGTGGKGSSGWGCSVSGSAGPPLSGYLFGLAVMFSWLRARKRARRERH
jgi:hypothetical protein